MESLYYLIPIAFVLLIIAIRPLSWAIKSGQYDDLDTEAHRILFDDTPHQPYRGSVASSTAVSEPQMTASSAADLLVTDEPGTEQSSSQQLSSEQPPSKS